MIQTIRKKLGVFSIPRHMIALLAGSSPFMFAFMIFIFAYFTRNSPMPHDTGWVRFLVQHQDEFVQSLIVSSVMVAVFFALLRNKAAIFAAGAQTATIQIMFIVADARQHLALNLPIAAIIILPLLILLLAFSKDIDQVDTQEETERPTDSEKQDTST